MKLQKIKSLFLKSLIVCVAAAALLAVVTVIIGHFNSLFFKALFTIMIVAIHSLISFGFIVNNEKKRTFDDLVFFTNATFVIIILSFVTSILGIWKLISLNLVRELYSEYFVFLFATLHAEVLFKTLGKQKIIDSIVRVNYIFMVIVVLMLIPVIFFINGNLPSIYYRLLAAAGIIDATLTLIAVIQTKLYFQKNPQINDNMFAISQTPLQNGQNIENKQFALTKKPKMNIFVKILIYYLVFQIIVYFWSFILTNYLHH